jgi:RNA recognition motif-containing protein
MSAQPNATLYVNNLNDGVNKEELRSQLYALFTTYGKVVDVVAIKNSRMRGQAFLVFSELAAATSAMRALEGMTFYDKPLVSSAITPEYHPRRSFFALVENHIRQIQILCNTETRGS